MSQIALPAIATLIAALFAAAGVTAILRRWAALATAAGCAIGAAVSLAFLLSGATPASLPIPLGLPGVGMTLAIDGLSGFFLLLLFLAGGAAAVAAIEAERHDPATAPFLPAFIAAMALTLIAADGFALLLGFELMSLASFALVLTGHKDATVRKAALLYIGMAALGAACLLACLALLAQGRVGIDLRFAALRAHPPEGWRAVAVVMLAIIGAGSKAGLAPLHVWLPPAHAAAPGHVSALMSGVMTKVALYVLIRILFDLAGPAPAWAAAPLLLLGAAGAVFGALRANLEGDIKAVLACSTVENIGLITAGLGLAIAARAADLTAIASLAAGAALLHAMAHGMFKPLLFLGAGAIQHGAGTRRLDRLGGLVSRMPVTSACVMVGAASLAALPPSAGFAGEWALFQAVLAAPRIGGLGTQILVCIVAVLMALGAALAATAAVRLVGVGLLGRPRSPRAAAAEDPGPLTRAALLGLAAGSVLVGIFPSAVLGLAAPALRLMAGSDFGERAGALAFAPAADVAGYSAPAVLLLLVLAAGGIVLLLRRFAVGGHRTGPAWDCGFGEAPAWLPFGDPATQYGGASFGQPLRRALGVALLEAQERIDMPAPGDRRPAVLTASFADPAQTRLFDPLGRLRDRVSGFADSLQFLTVRVSLSLMVISLIVLLALIALVEQA